MLVRFSTRRLLALMALDLGGSIALLYGAASIRRWVGIVPPQLVDLMTSWGIPVLPLPTVLLVAVIWPFFFVFVFGVYESHRNETLLNELRNVTTAVCVSFITLTGVMFFTYRNSSRLTVLIFLVSDLTLLLSARVAIWAYRHRYKRSAFRNRQVVVLVGAGGAGQHVAAQFANYGDDLHVVGFVDDDPAKLGRTFTDLPVLGTTADLPRIVSEAYVDDAVVALPFRAHERIVEVCQRLQQLSVRVHVVPDLFALSFPSRTLHGFGGIPMVDLGYTGISGWRLFWKRLFDIGATSCTVLAAVPVMLVVAIAIKLDSHGPVFYRQRRIGRNHRPFDMLKFRSMKVDADPSVHQRYITDLITRNISLDNLAVAPAGGARGEGTSPAASLKLVDDPRITRVGRFIRKTSLDELPQLFNVLKGDMSLVGPRPPMDYEVKLYLDWHRRRFEAPPGITGFWQVHGRNRVSFDEMVRMDLEYISRQSLWLDVKLLLQTPLAMISGRGAG
jgi:exopolysaccharide biosynthesis polyprenyl glycosylphosphotransferase